MKIKALIIDKKSDYRDSLVSIMSDLGVDCDIFSNGKDALESEKKPEYAFIFVSRYLEDTGGELFLHHYQQKYFLADALTIMITEDEVTEIMLEANKAGFKLVFNEKDVNSIQAFLIRVVNNRTLDLRGKILYVEDQQSVAAMTTALFESYLADVDHVKTVDAAKVKFTENNYDLVITDYYLSGNETGNDIIELIRSYNDSDKARIPILVVSGEKDQGKRTAFLRNGANDFIIKPFDQDELVVRVSNLISNKKIEDQARNQQQELLQLAMFDQLTGLYNRHSLFDLAPKYISDAKRHKFSIALLVIDLDFFKKVNDTQGHAAGDNVLTCVGHVLKDHCRNEDFVARFGGEEFVMLLPHCDLISACAKAEEIREKIEESKPCGLTITASIGVAVQEQDDDFSSLFDKADNAVYKAKETGRNKVVSID